MPAVGGIRDTKNKVTALGYPQPLVLVMHVGMEFNFLKTPVCRSCQIAGKITQDWLHHLLQARSIQIQRTQCLARVPFAVPWVFLGTRLTFCCTALYNHWYSAVLVSHPPHQGQLQVFCALLGAVIPRDTAFSELNGNRTCMFNL